MEATPTVLLQNKITIIIQSTVKTHVAKTPVLKNNQDEQYVLQLITL